jgi:uncharacterized protein (TIGR02284 family)
MEVREPGLRTILEENAHSLSQLIDEMQAQMRLAKGEPATAEHSLDAARRSLSLSITRAITHGDDAWIRRLSRYEARMCRCFDRALESAPAEMIAVLHRQVPRLRAIHLDMHSLAKAISH